MTNNLDFETFLKEIDDSNFNGGFHGLPADPSPLDISKFNIQQEILRFQREQELSDEELAQKINLTLAETTDLLFGKLNLFTLDRIMSHANYLFNDRLEVIIIKEKSNHFLRNKWMT